MMEKFALFVDAGHGGLVNGRYLTPGKRSYHEGKTYHDGGWFYEGVANRSYADEFVTMAEAAGLKVFKTYHPFVDTPLLQRSKMVNSFSKGYERSLLLSFHSNAANGKARGFSVWTTPGVTQSDRAATLIMDNYKKLLPTAKILTDFQDKDPDFEADFFILRSVKCPAVLLEYLFFDNPYDCDIIMFDQDARKKYLQACLNAVLEFRGPVQVPA